jgi:hypothetical protein
MRMCTLPMLFAVIAAGLPASSTIPVPAQASERTGFRCGPGFLTYTVKVQAGSTGGGVRCVKFHNYRLVDGQMTGVYWYGEGTLNQYVYRHLGNVYLDRDPATGRAQVVSLASDIYGNGENAEFTASDLKLTPVDGIKLIQETSEWPEQWILEPTGRTAYTSTLKPVRNCGRFFTTFRVEGGEGVRCAMRSRPGEEYPDLVWYGDSERGSRRHFGIVTRGRGQDAQALAIDLCDGARCRGRLTYRLMLRSLDRCGRLLRLRVSGDWNELWRSTEELTCAR